MRRLLVQRGRYVDSVFLLRISRTLEETAGVTRAVVVMGTPANLENLVRVGFEIRESIRPDDLVIGLETEQDGAVQAAEEMLARLLAAGTEASEAADVPTPTLGDALALDPTASLALVSVPGAYAAAEARRALRRGLHVMVFSDNVSIEDEVSLKDEAARRGLLVMGPDCGTAIVGGVPLGFANVVRRGPIGVVGASGTGIQEITSLVDRWGGGISHALGTGGRDLSKTVGGRSTLAAIDALAADPETRVLVVVSKAPAPEVAERVLDRLAATRKPAVVQFVGSPSAPPRGLTVFADTLADAARRALELAGRGETDPSGSVEAHFSAERGSMRGLFCGGTLAQEAWTILRRRGIDVRSNVAGDAAYKVTAETEVDGHVVWDLGDDAFTVGRPHPMIEPELRDDEVARAVGSPSVGIVLVDCVLGYGAHRDPAGSLARAVERAAGAGRRPAIVASVTGTARDPQSCRDQRQTLEEAGIHVAESNAQAAQWCADLLSRNKKGAAA